MCEEKKLFEYQNEKEAYHRINIIEGQTDVQKENYYEESMNALVYYMENNEINPNEDRWNKYAINQKYLSSKTLGYLSGMGFNTLCRKMRKELNRKKRQKED